MTHARVRRWMAHGLLGATLVASALVAAPAATAGAAVTGIDSPRAGTATSPRPPTGTSGSATTQTGTLSEVSPSGQTVLAVSIPSVWGLTSDASGDAYAAGYTSGIIFKVTPAGAMTTYLTGFPYLYAMTMDPSGNLYVNFNEAAHIYKIAPNGSETTFNASLGSAGLYFDAATGYLYAANDSEIYRLDSGGTATPFATVAGGTDWLGSIGFDPVSGTFIASDYDTGIVYSIDRSGNATELFSSSALPGDPAELWSAGSNAYGQIFVTSIDTYRAYEVGASVNVSDLSVTPGVDSLTASWQGPQGLTTYRCTLMYGFGEPSGFSQVVSGNSCTFSGLSPTTGYGIAVTASWSVSAANASSIAYGQPLAPVVTITCVHKHHTRHVSGTSPVCPAGWRRTA